MTSTFNHLFHGAPPWLIAAATLGVIIHVSAGLVGILAGAAAISVRKGERLHRSFGTVFFVAMLTMAGAASVLAVVLVARGVTSQWVNVFAGIFTLYLVGTGWGAVKRKAGTVGRLEAGAFVAGVGIAAVAVFGILPFALGPAGREADVPAVAPLMFAAVAMLGAAMDLKVILHGGISGSQRLARHLWRMCLGWFIATGSFFLGQQKDMPAFLHGSPILLILAMAPLALLLFWMFRVRLTKVYRTHAVAA
ncbi:MAG TPA: DUF2306 domain-containing protein [Caulobacteraceae bacterium]